MAINIEDFRRSLNVDLSRDLVQKILTKYENFDFSNATTNNGSKLSVIDSIDTTNITEVDVKPYVDYINKDVRLSYIRSKDAEYKIMLSAPEEVKKIASDINKVLKSNLYSRPDSTTITSKLLLDNPQTEEPIHLLIINTDSSNIFSIVNSLINDFTKLEIPFDIEFPKKNNFAEGKTESIKLRVTTSDLEDTIKAIARVHEVYKDKMKKPNMFNANVQDYIGYDSLIDVNGTRTSDLLGTAIVKAIDSTLVELAKEESFDGASVVDYIKNAENKDLARQRVIKTVKEKYPNIIDPVLQNTKEAIKTEGLAVDIDNVYTSKRASDELNEKYGVLEDVVINVNEVSEEKEDKLAPIKEAAQEVISPIIDKTTEVINTIKDGVEVVKDPFRDYKIQPAIDFGAGSIEKIAEEANQVSNTEPSDELKVENPSVTVIEPIIKAEELTEMPEPSFDKIEENQAPVLTADAINETSKPALPGEEGFESAPVEKEVDPMATGIKEVITPEPVEPKEVTPIVAPSVAAAPIITQPELVQTELVDPKPIEEVTQPVLETPAEPVPTQTVIFDEQPSEVKETAPAEELDKTQVLTPVQNEQEPQTIQEELNTSSMKDEELKIPSLEEFINEPTAQASAPVQEAPAPVEQAPVQAQTQEVQEDDEIEKMLKSIESSVNDSTIEFTDQQKQEVNNLSEQKTAIPETLNLTGPERAAQIAADEVMKERKVDPERQAKIDKYNGIFLDNQALDFHVRNKNDEELIKPDGTPYTLLDYLEDNKVLEKIDLNSKYYLKDQSRYDYLDGKSFIREYVSSFGCNGNMPIEEGLDWYVSKVTNLNEQPKKKGLFGFGKK